MNRVTTAVLDARIATINSLLGHTETPAFSTIGAFTLEGAYGGTAVAQYVNDAGAVRMHTSYGTKREALDFLNGVITGIRALDNATPF